MFAGVSRWAPGTPTETHSHCVFAGGVGPLWSPVPFNERPGPGRQQQWEADMGPPSDPLPAAWGPRQAALECPQRGTLRANTGCAACLPHPSHQRPRPALPETPAHRRHLPLLTFHPPWLRVHPGSQSASRLCEEVRVGLCPASPLPRARHDHPAWTRTRSSPAESSRPAGLSPAWTCLHLPSPQLPFLRPCAAHPWPPWAPHCARGETALPVPGLQAALPGPGRPVRGPWGPP